MCMCMWLESFEIDNVRQSRGHGARRCQTNRSHLPSITVSLQFSRLRYNTVHTHPDKILKILFID